MKKQGVRRCRACASRRRTTRARAREFIAGLIPGSEGHLCILVWVRQLALTHGFENLCEWIMGNFFPICKGNL